MIVELITLFFSIIFLCFGYVLLFGAPYLPTMNKQVEAAIKLANLKPGQTLLELGSGDGRVLIAAAQAGLNAVGYELNPVLFFISWLRTRRYGKQIKIELGNFWTNEWPKCDAVYVFLLPRLMPKLEQKIKNESFFNTPIISFAFKFNKIKPLNDIDGVFLYQLNDKD